MHLSKWNFLSNLLETLPRVVGGDGVPRKLDWKDRMILELLRENARRSLTEIASLVGVSRPTVSAHIDRLLSDGIIARFTVDVRTPEELRPAGVRAMFDVRLRRNVCGKVFSSISHWNELVSAWSTTGSVDMKVLVEAADQRTIEELRNRLARHPEVATLVTTMILKTWCERISGIHEVAPEEYQITRKAVGAA